MLFLTRAYAQGHVEDAELSGYGAANGGSIPSKNQKGRRESDEKMKMKKLCAVIILIAFLASMSSITLVQAATVGLVGEWNLDEAIGSIAEDTANGNDGILSGGKFGNALLFDGVSSYVSVPTGTLSIAGPFTVEAWIYRNALGDLQYVLSKDDGPSLPYSNYNLLSFSGNKLALFLKGLSIGTATKGTAYSDPGGGGIVGVTSIGVDGNWHHVAGVFTGTLLQVYLDGVLDGSVAVTGTPYTNFADLWIGNRKYSAGYFNGKIDEVRISNAAITSFDLSQAPTIETSTVALWHFDESVGATVFDEAGDNDGTIHGATWAGPVWVTDGWGTGLKFDGVDDYVEVADADSLDITGGITVEAWIYPELTSGYRNIVSKRFGSVANYALRLNGKNVEFYFAKPGESWSVWATNTAVITSSYWHHIVVTYKFGDTASIAIYVDGASQTGSWIALDQPDTAGNTYPLHIGFNYAGYPQYFKGIIDSVKIFNYPITGLTLAFDSVYSAAVAPVFSDADVRVCLKDASGNAVEGMDVNLAASSGLELSSPGGLTGTDGCYTFKVRSEDAGVYTITATVTPLVGSDVIDTWTIAIYDPSAGFVTGGGWIYSLAGAYAEDPLLEGKATFGFVSKYQKGANVPTGNTEFVFHVAGMKFKSTNYEWLVVAGTTAQYKGRGTINGLGDYKFMLWAGDGGKTGADTFRIKIWDASTEAVVYDNGVHQEISGGSIVIHK